MIAIKSLFVIAVIFLVQDLVSFKLSSNKNHVATNRNLRLHSSKKLDAIRSTELSSSHLKFTIMGGGAFSLAMAKILTDKNISVSMLVRNQTVADYINEHHFHPKYLPDCPLPTQLWATSDAAIALKDADYMIHAVPCQSSRQFLNDIKHLMPPNAPIMSVTKGVEEGTFCLMSDILFETLGPKRRTAYLSGPSFAKEVMAGEATAVVIASNCNLAGELSQIISSSQFRCHTTGDVKGLELGGAMKNVIALAAGMCEGLGLGMNAMASLVTRGCQEMGSVGELFGGEKETFGGLAGVGDTFGTCMGPLSRNRQVGVRLAKGESLEHIIATSDTTEGVATALALQKLLMTKVDPRIVDFKFPIISGVTAILNGFLTPSEGLTFLMQYPVRDENGSF